MKKYFIIELGGEKETEEMKALELEDIHQAIEWIENSIEDDAEYFEVNINYDINIIKYEFCGSDLDFYTQALVCVEYETIVTEEMFASDVYSVEDIIKSDLSIVSKIKARMVEE